MYSNKHPANLGNQRGRPALPSRRNRCRQGPGLRDPCRGSGALAVASRIAVEARIARGMGISLAPPAVPASRRIGLAWRGTSSREEEFRLLASTLRELTDVA